MTGPATAKKEAATGRPKGPSDDWELTHAAWGVVGAIGLTLLVMGLVDIAIEWLQLPPQFGSPDWELGTISQTMNFMPVSAMGLALLLAHGVATERRAQLVAVGIWSGLVVLFFGVCVVLYALDVPLALRAVQDPVKHRLFKAGVVKAVAAFLAYGLFYLWGAIFAFRRSAKR